MIATLFFSSVLIAILAFDWLTLPPRARRLWKFMFIAFSGAIVAAFRQDWVQSVAHSLGIGRGVDLVVYVSLAVLFREYFLRRFREQELQEKISQLVRELAIRLPEASAEKERH